MQVHFIRFEKHWLAARAAITQRREDKVIYIFIPIQVMDEIRRHLNLNFSTGSRKGFQ